MSEAVAFVTYGRAPPYDHGPTHPLRPQRVWLTEALVGDYGLLGRDGVTTLTGRDATDAELALVHDLDYVDAVRRAGHGQPGSWWRYGFGPGDNPLFPRMHEASARVAGSTLVAAEAVWSGRVEHAFNPSGGLHHAMASRASGFCVYDDPAVAIAWLLAQGAGKVAYVDVDVHHGDGPQALFYADPRVLTVSIHELGTLFFPGTGAVEELGAGEAEGTAVNVPLPAGAGDDAWLAAFTEVVPPLVEAWRPDVLVTQLGCDSHHTDPLAHLMLTTAAYRQVAAVLHELAHRAAGGRWVATGGGGYQWARVVPRAWTLYFAEMAGAELADEVPEAWWARATGALGRADVPRSLAEPALDLGSGGGVDEARAVAAEVRRLVFPRHGLRP